MWEADVFLRTEQVPVAQMRDLRSHPLREGVDEAENVLALPVKDRFHCLEETLGSRSGWTSRQEETLF